MFYLIIIIFIIFIFISMFYLIIIIFIIFIFAYMCAPWLSMTFDLGVRCG